MAQSLMSFDPNACAIRVLKPPLKVYPIVKSVLFNVIEAKPNAANCCSESIGSFPAIIVLTI